MKVGDRVWVKGENRLGRIFLTVEEHGQLLYVVLYDVDTENGVSPPPDEVGPVFGIVCAASLLATLEETGGAPE